jgi:hypothetical protein
VFQTGCGKDRKSFNDSAQTLAQNQTLKVCHDSFPFVVVWVREPLERQFGGKETIFW